MALPSIPTSFVPHSASSAAQRFRSDFSGTFDFFAYGVLGIVFIFALGVFFYGRILAGTQTSKDAALAEIEKKIDPAAVQDFVRLRDRLNSGTSLLEGHIAFSNFFTLLGTLLPSSVRFTSLHLSFDAARKARIEGAGVAKSFNALAAISSSFATDGRIKDAIFSNIVINLKDNSVSFALTATLDPKTTAFMP